MILLRIGGGRSAAVAYLRTGLGRIIRDIRRKIDGQPALEEEFALPLVSF